VVGGGSGGNFSLWFPVTPDLGLLHFNVSGTGERFIFFPGFHGPSDFVCFSVSFHILSSVQYLLCFLTSSYAFLCLERLGALLASAP
jgi:hypothetical protein